MKLSFFIAVWLGALAVASASPEAVPATNSALVTRVVRQYALTSANDFPQRDLQDWRLLGSNDGGKTWTTLDVRKDQVFSERHQRRLFQVTNAAPFNLYRLQIDRVRDPAAADCVQLAEVEPLGETEYDLDPAPLPGDIITAQGENAPVETRFQAFDSRVETKWLDHAAQNPGSRASWIQWQYSNPASLIVTNIEQLLGLRNRAGHGYAVRLEAVVAGWLPGTNVVCILDATGHLEIPEAPAGELGISQGVSQESTSSKAPAGAPALPVGLVPGQRVRLEGTTQWTGQQAGVGPHRFQVQGPAVPAEPRRVELGEPLGPAQDWQWVEVEGRFQFCTRLEDQLVFELEDGQRNLTVRVLHAGPEEKPPAAGTQVRVRGLCGGVLDTRGQRVAGALWTPSLASVAPVVAAKNTAPASADLPRTLGPGAANLPLTRIEQIHRLSPEELSRGPKVKVRGVVTELFGGFIQDENAGVEVWLRGEATLQPPGFGTCVELEGKADWALGHGPVIRADKVVCLGPGKLPAAEPCTWSQLASGRMVDQWIEIVAVVHATDGSHLLLNCEGGQLMATIRSAPARLVKRLVDATVRVRGVNVAASDNRGQLQGIQLLVPSLEFVEIQEAPPGDPFALPARPIGSLLQVRGPKEFIHRVKVEGMLTFREGRKYFMQDATGGAMAIAQEDVILNTPAGGWSWTFRLSSNTNRPPAEELNLTAGDQLQAVGFPETRGYSPVLTEVLVRKVPRTAPVSPARATISDIAGGGLDSMLVSLEAVLLQQEVLGPHWVLGLQSGQRVFQAFVPAGTGPRPAIAPGSRLRVTGVCQVEPVPYAELGKREVGFKLLVGSPGDLAVLERPSWWTLKRALLLTGALVVVLAIAAAWISILRRQVEDRTRQLQQEIEQHKKTEARLAEGTRLLQAEIEERKRIEAEVERGHKQLLKASRLAGMAEVATSVLHNVGNVLNSANVLASLIAEQVQRSKIPSVARLAALLTEHQAEIGRFMTEDGRGQQLPGYVTRLAAHLAEEQTRLLEKIKALAESLQHIKEIVATQQNYAKVSGLLETVSLQEILEDALRIHEGAIVRHQIKVNHEYQETVPVTIDRHKVLQILFNLLENAKYACDDGTRDEKQITVRIQQPDPKRIRVCVADNGVGIPPENLPRLFDQDFSTRKGGHGFGLHSSLLAAQDLGGSLTAHSDGPGKGASFTLELPVRREG